MNQSIHIRRCMGFDEVTRAKVSGTGLVSLLEAGERLLPLSDPRVRTQGEVGSLQPGRELSGDPACWHPDLQLWAPELTETVSWQLQGTLRL